MEISRQELADSRQVNGRLFSGYRILSNHLKGNCGTSLPGQGAPFSEVISENSVKIGKTVQKL